MRRQKTSQIVITFHTTAEAIATERLCEKLQLAGKLIPAPRTLTSDCGIAWSAPLELRPRLLQALSEAAVEYDGVYELLL